MSLRTFLAAIALVCLPGVAHAQATCETRGDGPSHLATRTARLGLQFVQDGRPVDIYLPDHRPREPAPTTASVRLRRAPFEIRAPLEAWSDRARDAGLAIAVSDEPCFADMLHLRRAAEETPYFGLYRAMADHPFGAGRLISARGRDDDDYGYNYIVDGRFNASGDDYRGLLVSRIDRRFGDDDLMQVDTPVTMVFYLDQRAGRPPTVSTRYGPSDMIDTLEVDVVFVTFVD